MPLGACLSLLFTMAALATSQQLQCSSNVPNARPPPKQRHFVSAAVEAAVVSVTSQLRDKDLAQLFANCFPNTLDTTVSSLPNAMTFVITVRESERASARCVCVCVCLVTRSPIGGQGDLPAMWLRDSTNQLASELAPRHSLR